MKKVTFLQFRAFILTEGATHIDLPPTKVKFAFTLAEILITLGIIGIVAAMTIPGLIAKYKEIQYRTIYKKVYSSLNQAMKYAQEDDGVDLSLGNILYDGGVTPNTIQIGEIFKYLSRYYNAKTTCFENNADKCWVCEKGEAGEFSGGAPNWLGCSKSSYSFIDANGVAYYLYSNREFPILIDVNGNRNPNQLGRDRFVMYFGYSLEPNNHYPDTVDAVLLASDRKSKSRWCPQGDCLYKTWINSGK